MVVHLKGEWGMDSTFIRDVSRDRHLLLPRKGNARRQVRAVTGSSPRPSGGAASRAHYGHVLLFTTHDPCQGRKSVRPLEVKS